MMKIHYVKSARRDIYQRGREFYYISRKNGAISINIDHTRICAVGEDKLIIPQGQPYYWCKLGNGKIYYSKDKPRKSQLAEDDFLQEYYSIQEKVGDAEVKTIFDLYELLLNVLSGIKLLLNRTVEKMFCAVVSGSNCETLSNRIREMQRLYNEFNRYYSSNRRYEWDEIGDWDITKDVNETLKEVKSIKFKF